jgi:ketosteroid isomerase-like protein
MKKLLFIFALAVAIVIACTETKQKSVSSEFDLDEGRKAVDADNAKYMEEVRNGDTVALAEHYHPDGLIMPPNTEAVGKDKVAEMWGMMKRFGVAALKMNTNDLVGQGDLMVETGTFELLAEGDSSLDKGKYIVVWKKDGETWKIYRDIINSNIPAAQAAH